MPDLADKFAEFDAQHPDIWELFQQVAFELIRKDIRHYSADGVLHVVRFQHHTSTTGQSPKINNNLSAGYARKWRKAFPQHADFFQLRRSEMDQGFWCEVGGTGVPPAGRLFHLRSNAR